MSLAEILLNDLPDDYVARYSTERNEGLIIIGYDRFIVVPEELKRIAVQYDHDIETVTFCCPRYWDDLDMFKMQIFINYQLSDGTTGSYVAQNIEVADDVMYFDWTISKNITKLPGQISFLVCVRKTDAEGNLVNHWNSELCTDMYVSAGLETLDDFVKVEKDLVTQLLTRMTAVEQINVQANRMEEILVDAEVVFDDTVAAKNAAVAAQNAAKSFVDTAKTSYANAIKGSATGSIIRVDDVSPVEHVVKCRAHNVDPSAVTLKRFGRNILRFTESFEKEMYGVKVTYDRNKDEFTINGTPTSLGFSVTLASYTEKTYIRKGDKYTITLEHISGSMSAVSDTNVFYTGTSNAIDGTYGNWNPVQYVNSGKASNTRTANNDFLVRAWVYISPHDTTTFNNYKFRVQLEVGETSSAHDSTQAESYSVGTDGSVDIYSVAPTMTLMTDTAGVTIDCEYNRDTNVVFGELIARINELEKG